MKQTIQRAGLVVLSAFAGLGLVGAFMALSIGLALAQGTTVTTVPAAAGATTVVVPGAPDTVVSLGDTVWQIGSALLILFANAIAAFITRVVWTGAQAAKINLDDQRKAQFQALVVRGMHWAAAQMKDRLQGRGQVDVHNELLAKTIEYVNMHGADLLKMIGDDPPNSAKANSAITARVEQALADPATPTPPAIPGSVNKEPAIIFTAPKV